MVNFKNGSTAYDSGNVSSDAQFAELPVPQGAEPEAAVPAFDYAAESSLVYVSAVAYASDPSACVVDKLAGTEWAGLSDVQQFTAPYLFDTVRRGPSPPSPHVLRTYGDLRSAPVAATDDQPPLCLCCRDR